MKSTRIFLLALVLMTVMLASCMNNEPNESIIRTPSDNSTQINAGQSDSSISRPESNPATASDSNQLSGTYEASMTGFAPYECVRDREITSLRFSGNSVIVTISYEFIDFDTWRSRQLYPAGHNIDEARERDRYEESIIRYATQETRGTFSTTNEHIEFVWDSESPFHTDRTIDVFPFSRTENTISIEGWRFDRQR
jgi:hypothetical protein